MECVLHSHQDNCSKSPQSSHALYVRCREQAAREASSTAAIIDAQSVKSADKGGAWIDDAGKKIKGKKAACPGLLVLNRAHGGNDVARRKVLRALPRSAPRNSC